MTGTKRIPLPQGRFALVDEEDFAHLNQWRWNLRKTNYQKIGYAARTLTTRKENQKYKPLYMHREIMKCPKGLQIDHINGDTLDNRKQNLRICTPQQNSANSVIKKNLSGFRGVTKHRDKFTANIGNGKTHEYLGVFWDPRTAALAYDQAAEKMYGEFAKLNFPKRHQL